MRVLWVASSLFVIACSSSSAPEQKDPIDIGLLTSISGDLAGLGREYTDATTLAFSEINDAGGVLGRSLRIALQDDGGSVDTAMVGYGALLDIRTPVILGPTFSAAVVALSPLMKSGGTVTIGQTTTSTVLTTLDDGGYFFRTVASDLVQADVLADVIGEQPLDTLCIVARKDVYGRALSQSTKRNLAAAGKMIRYIDAEYDSSQADLSRVLDVCGDPSAAGDRGLLFITFVADGAALVNDAIRRGFTPSRHKFFFTDGAQDPLLFTLLDDPTSLDGARGVGPSGPDPATEGGQRLRDFQQRFLTFFNREPTFYAENAYDAAYVAAMAIEIAGGVEDREAVKNAMSKVSTGTAVNAGEWSKALPVLSAEKAGDYRGASGEVNFDIATGDLDPPYHVSVWSISDSRIQIVEIRRVTDKPL